MSAVKECNEVVVQSTDGVASGDRSSVHLSAARVTIWVLVDTGTDGNISTVLEPNHEQSRDVNVNGDSP